MQTIIFNIENLLGYLMYICYSIISNYGLAIILFTFLTKIILLPVSIIVQKNSIKMVKMMPELNFIKAENFGDSETIAEEQMKLYKKEKYHPLAGLVPLFLQIFLLILVINVIYKPLHHVLQLDNVTINNIIQYYCNITNTNPEIGSIQLAAVNYFSTMGDKSVLLKVISSDIVNSISALRMQFLFFDLTQVPMTAGGISMLIPLLAGGSAFILCYVQDHINVLQAEQGRLNKVCTMLLSVGLALYLGFFVPVGVGLYWIFSNFFSILQLMFLNIIINPNKQVDYEQLEKSRVALAKVQRRSKSTKNILEKDPFAEKEKADYKRFFKSSNKQVVFYSEKSGFYKYFQNVIEYLLKETSIIIHYVTNDPKDLVFGKTAERFNTYYISNKKTISFMMKMDADMVVMSTPDLEKYQIKRSLVRKDVEYVYIYHAVNSTNMCTRTGSLDYFDTIFLPGPRAGEEIRAIEKLHNSQEKNLLPWGSSVIDNMIAAYENMEIVENEKKTILIAPSWQEDNILDLCIESILDQLCATDYKVVVRPHPQYLRYAEDVVDSLKSKYEELSDGKIIVEKDFSSNVTVYTADLLITDWSSIAFEYSFATLKPVLFINTPMKVINKEYAQINVEPIDIVMRNAIGKSLDLNCFEELSKVAEELIENQTVYSDKIREIRNQELYCLGTSGKVGAEYIEKRIVEIDEQKEEYFR